MLLFASSKHRRTLTALALVSVLAGLTQACSDDAANDGSGGAGASASGTGTNTGTSTSSENGSSSSGFGNGGSSSTGIEPCAQQEAEATLVSKPVDIIFVIDNSGSMTAEIIEVEKQINQNFANIIDAAVPAIDYRVIMVSRHGNAANQRVCIAEPLSGVPDADNDGRCDTIPAQPVNTPKFVHHSAAIGSRDSLCKLIQQHDVADEFGLQPNGYGAALRPEAFKFFVVITDDRVNCSFGNVTYNDNNTVVGGEAAAALFENELFTRWPAEFGADAASRNYRFWSIISLAPFNPSAAKPYGDPYPPTEPVTTSVCTPGAVAPATGYQALSILTGGSRYPTCGLDYTDIFTQMAYGVIEGAQVACEFLIPEPPVGETLNLATVQVEYTSGANVDTFDQVPSLADCTDGKFYIAGDQIILCPTTCDVVRADENAEIDIKFGCDVTPQ
jgi:hypothetical protein